MQEPNPFKEAWEKIEKESPLPRRLRRLVKVDFDKFKERILQHDPQFVQGIVESLHAGDVYILKKAFSPPFFSTLRSRLMEHGQHTPSQFFKMLEGCPNYHRIINDDIAKNYSFYSIKHSFYFFPWNKDEFGVFSEAYPRWRIIKFLSGYPQDEYEKNTPKDGITDRLQIVHYPSGAGCIETHSDPFKCQRLIISCFMTKRGKDYNTGGVYFVDAQNQKVDMEDEIDVGDMQIYYPTILHGVATIDAGATPDWTSLSGRWWFGPFSNSTDHVQERHMGFGVKEEDIHKL